MNLLSWPATAALAAALALSSAAVAQTEPAPAEPPADRPTARPSAMDGELLYQVLLGELYVRQDDPGVGFALLLDAARRTHDEELFQRAVEVAYRARAGEEALRAARVWKAALPESREANRAMLQILLQLNRVSDSAPVLQSELAAAGAAERNAVINAIPRLYARVSDKAMAAQVVEQVLAPFLTQADTAAAGWSTVGRLRLAADDAPGALQAAQRSQAASATSIGAALLGLELMEARQPEAERLVRRYLQSQPAPEVRMGYARLLLDTQRYAEALDQLQILVTEKPDFPEAWLVQGVLLAQDGRLDAAQTALKRYLDLAQEQPASEARARGLAQAYLALAQIAEKRGQYEQAEQWLDKIDNPQDLIAAQNRRASILASQGKLEQARQLLRALPQRNANEARLKLLAEVQLLRDQKQNEAAYALLGQAVANNPDDTDLAYDQAMLAEKLGRFDDMERLLRSVIAAKPQAQHAYNALGYSLAQRGVRLQEARSLIEQALALAPGDAFITDSLGWVEFRLGLHAQALKTLQQAYQARPDAEIAAHLGEVLWTMGQRERALAIWREGLLQNPDNETLLEAIKRLGARP